MKQRLLMALLSLALTVPALPAELVINGGFENTGSGGALYDGWTNTNNHLHDDSAHSGLVGVGFGSGTLFPDTLSQTLATLAGQSYTLSFWLFEDASPNTFQVFWGGQTILNRVNQVTSGYQFYSFAVTAASNSTVLSFVGANPPGHDYLDDVSVTSAVPEPATWATMVLGLAALGFAVRRRQATAR